MISPENTVFTLISTALRERFEEIYVAGEYVSQPPQFPAVFIEEANNTTDRRTLDSGYTEQFANLTYTVDVFSNRARGKKAECRAIANFIDNIFVNQLRHRRVNLIPAPNLNDSTIYRMRGTYESTVRKDGNDDYTIWR